MALVKWSQYSDYTPAFSSSDLRNKANNTRVGSNQIDNSTTRFRWMDVVCDVRFAVSPSDGGFIALYLIPAIDNQNYVDGSSSVAPQTNLLIATFKLRQTTTPQKLAARNIMIPPCKFILLWENRSGQTTADLDNANQIYYRLYTEEIV
jgi:hypothetical protein